MIGRKDWFESLKPFTSHKSVELGDKHPLHIEGFGTIGIKIKGGVQKIANVLFVRGLKKNLLSVSQLKKKKLRTVFDENGFVIF